MNVFLQLFLPVYFLVYFLIVFVIRTVVVAKQVGYSPVVLPTADDAYGLVGRYFKATLVGLSIYVLVIAFRLDGYEYFGDIPILEQPIVRYAGIVFLVSALVWTAVAQIHMRLSWRIGIDMNNKTALITTGLFSYSRNPIFLGMLASLLGLFLVTPNLVSLFLFLLGYVLIQLQIRLEETHLQQVHGQVYVAYTKKTRRLLGRKGATWHTSVMDRR